MVCLQDQKFYIKEILLILLSVIFHIILVKGGEEKEIPFLAISWQLAVAHLIIRYFPASLASQYCIFLQPPQSQASLKEFISDIGLTFNKVNDNLHSWPAVIISWNYVQLVWWESVSKHVS